MKFTLTIVDLDIDYNAPGSPISGALLTADYHWWRADLFAGVSYYQPPVERYEYFFSYTDSCYDGLRFPCSGALDIVSASVAKY